MKGSKRSGPHPNGAWKKDLILSACDYFGQFENDREADKQARKKADR